MPRVVAAILAVGALAAPTAVAQELRTGESLGALDRKVAVSSLGTTVAWSEPVDDVSFRLVIWRGGRRIGAPVGTRRGPFDLDVGTDARGRTVVTYSRCQKAGVPPAGWGEYPHDVWATTARCSAYEYRVGARAERRLAAAPGDRGSVEMPTRWRGTTAYVLRAGDRREVRVFAPGARRSSRRLLLKSSRDRVAKLDLYGNQLAASTSRAVQVCPESGEGDRRVLPRLSQVLLLRPSRPARELARGCEFDGVLSVGEASVTAAGVTFLATVGRGVGAGLRSDVRTRRNGATSTQAWVEPDARLTSLGRGAELVAVRRRAGNYDAGFDVIRLG
jgi:hypothetical protein